MTLALREADRALKEAGAPVPTNLPAEDRLTAAALLVAFMHSTDTEAEEEALRDQLVSAFQNAGGDLVASLYAVAAERGVSIEEARAVADQIVHPAPADVLHDRIVMDLGAVEPPDAEDGWTATVE